MRPPRAPNRPGLLLLLAAAFAPALAGVACETVDLGQPPADVNACRPSQQFFVDEIWPNFLAKDGYAGGVHCYDSACHGALAPNALDLVVPTTPGYLPLTGDWLNNYTTATEEMNCANVAASKLLEYPAGLRVHFGDKLIEPDGPEATLIKMWISQP
jgi:hypothetical protein